MSNSAFSNSAPQQKRLDTNIPAPTVFQAQPSMAAMHNQWKCVFSRSRKQQNQERPHPLAACD